MLLSSPKYLGTLLALIALIVIFHSRRHAAEDSLGQRAMGDAYETSDQTVIGGDMTDLQQAIVYDKLSGDTPSDIEANWSATLAAKGLLQKVRDFRDGTQASYNDDSKTGVRQRLEDAELALENLGKQTFDTRKIVRGVQKLEDALKAAEEVIARGPDAKTMSSKSADEEKSADEDRTATQPDEALQEAEADRMRQEKAALLEKLEKAELDAVIAESKESPEFR